MKKFNNFLFLLIASFFVFEKLSSQTSSFPQPSGSTQLNPCASLVPDQKWEAQFAKLIEEYKIQAGANKSQGVVYTIPVIVHVIHSGQAVGTYPNLAQGQVNSQIRVLNDDFGGVGYNTGNYPTGAFSTYAVNQNLPASNLDILGRVQIANCEVQFCMATKDSLGNTLPEPGIDRINYISKGWSNPASFANINSFTNYMSGTIKPASIWNVSKYFNIWISDVNGSTGLLGYATFPSFANLSGLNIGSNGTPLDDGVWCYARAFGSVDYFPGGSYSGANNRGRTSSHEVGHWLGLRHIWGDGNCLSDFCNDTPTASSSNFGNPTYPFKTTNCTGNAANGEMFMNFMDYVNDAAKYMFTPDQALRVKTAMLNSPYRKFLGTHNLCSVSQVPAIAQFNMTSSTCEGAVVNLINTSYGTPVPTYTWSATGGASINPNVNSALATVSFPSTGTFVVTLAAGNGSTSIATKTIQVNAAPVVVIAGLLPTVCIGDDVTLIAGGATSYTWEPGTITGNTFGYNATTEQSFTLTGSDGACKSTQAFTISVSECVGVAHLSKNEFVFTISPNPTSSSLLIHFGSMPGSTAKLEITDVSGKLVHQEIILRESKSNEKELDLRNYEKGLYFVTLSTENGLTKTLKVIKD